MAEYIDRENFRFEVINKPLKSKHAFTDDYCNGAEDMKHHILQLFDDAPAADVQKVKHGKWIYDTAHGAIACSACGCINLGYNGRPKPNYCPYCGAKMDGKVSD